VNPQFRNFPLNTLIRVHIRFGIFACFCKLEYCWPFTGKKLKQTRFFYLYVVDGILKIHFGVIGYRFIILVLCRILYTWRVWMKSESAYNYIRATEYASNDTNWYRNHMGPHKQVQSLFATHQPSDVDFTLIILNTYIDLTEWFGFL
jgi:hypothetical protein